MLDYEKNFSEKLICGVDEAGRGPLAGPVSCAAVIMPAGKYIEGVDDSKKLTERQRERLYGLIAAEALAYSVAMVDHLTIDRINILNATKLGMREAVFALEIRPELVLVDAVKLDIPYKQESIIHGDELSYNIAAASILAKVARDRLMTKMHRIYPSYGFDKHKGYGTKAHI
ncbi:MAG: ribonuclease HII, partial [Firmicutes bacterium]|nr:ribonuclease HII [Bacillota bacterium]